MTDTATETVATHVPAVDGLRAVAALGVVVVHCWGFAGFPRGASPIFGFLPATYVGVDMFFVISGFLLFLPYAAGRPLPLRSYFRRRAARLAPAYLVSIVVVLALFPLLYRPAPLPYPLATIPGVLALLAHLSLLHSIVLGWAPRWIGFGTNPVWWTLTHEACFYVALPLVATRFLRHPWRWTLSCVVVSVAWRFVAFHDQSWGRWIPLTTRGALNYFGDSLPGYWAHFAVGMAAAYAFVHAPKWTAARAWLALSVGAVVAGGAEWALGRDFVSADIVGWHPTHFVYVAGRTVFAAGFALALLALTRLRWSRVVFGSGPLKWIGDRSYGLYLFHYVIAGALVLHTPLFRTHPGSARTFFLGVLVVAPLGIAAGALSFGLIERPAMRWARRVEALPVSATATPLPPAAPDLHREPLPEQPGSVAGS